MLHVWVDAQLPPVLARWLNEVPDVQAVHILDLGLLNASDARIWDAARLADTSIVTKDIDFVDRVHRLGPPPQIVWVTTGNVSNRALRALIAAAWPRAVDLLHAGEPLVELGDR